MTEKEQVRAAQAFADYWHGKGDEKGQSQEFRLPLLRDVLGAVHPEHTCFTDGYVPSAIVPIEQKQRSKSLTNKTEKREKRCPDYLQNCSPCSLPNTKRCVRRAIG